MFFASPIWLIALAPLAGVVAWLLQSRPRRVKIPFLALWQLSAPVRDARRKFQRLPLPVLMVLLAALCAILASSRPALRAHNLVDQLPLTLIVDRGISMSVRTDGQLRYQAAVRTVVDALGTKESGRPVDLIVIPGGPPIHTTLANCSGELASLSPTAIQTTHMLSGVISTELLASRSLLLVVSDQRLQPEDRVVQIPPESLVENAAIVLLAAREQPMPQVMVRVRNQSHQTEAAMEVSSGDRSERQTIRLPARDATQDYFVNLQPLGKTITAKLLLNDDVRADDVAWLVREANWPKIEPGVAIPPELGRMIDVYQSARPATDDSSRLQIVSNPSILPPDVAAIVLATTGEVAPPGVIQVTMHPITAHVTWDRMPTPLKIAGDAPVGWTPIVSIDGHPLVAVRENPARQVWIGFDAPNWATTADFVIFWTNVFDWAGRGGESFEARSLADWSSEWKPVEPAKTEPGMWPGLYRRSDGALRAFNAPDVIFKPPPQIEWRTRLRGLISHSDGMNLSGLLLIIAASCMVVAALTWGRKTPASSQTSAAAAIPKSDFDRPQRF